MTRDEFVDRIASGDYEGVKDHLVLQMRDGQNQDYLQNKVWQPCGSLAAVVNVNIDSEEPPVTAAITQGMAHGWGVAPDTIFQDAMAAMRRSHPPVLSDIREILWEIASGQPGRNFLEGDIPAMEESQEPPMLILTDEQKYLGASYVTDPVILERIGQIFRSNYYVLPSSVHEAICVPVSIGTPEEVGGMVYEVNRQEYIVRANEVLSDRVQIYDRQEKTLVPCEPYVPKPEQQPTEALPEKSMDDDIQNGRRPHLKL